MHILMSCKSVVWFAQSDWWKLCVKTLEEGRNLLIILAVIQQQTVCAGHLVAILTSRRLQLAGHKPYALVGGTNLGLIGDPSPLKMRA